MLEREAKQYVANKEYVKFDLPWKKLFQKDKNGLGPYFPFKKKSLENWF